MAQEKLNPFIDARLEIRHVEEVGGRGVFAKEDIPAGTLIERAPLIIIPKALLHIGMWFLQAEGIPDEEFQLDQYSIDWNDNSVAVPLGWAGIYNHSDRNNSRFCYWTDDDPTVVGIITLSDIVIDQQLTVNYGSNWFDKKPYVNKVNL